MNVLLVSSSPDPASVAIATALKRESAWSPTGATVEGAPVDAWERDPRVRLVSTPRLHLEAEGLEAAARDAGVPMDAVVFLSRHRAASGRPSLTVHPVGNWGEAPYGGQPGRIAPAAAPLQSELLRALARRVAAGDYESEVTFEATHHGPLLQTPACFLELGSSEAQWHDPDGAKAVARALLDVVAHPLQEAPIVVGVGGGHYVPRFTEAALTRRVHFGHFLPTHALEAAGDAETALAQLVAQTPGCGAVYLHRKGLDAPTRQRWRAAAQALGVPVASSRDWDLRPTP